MAFLPNIPQSTDQLSVSQADILNNFTILGAIAGNASVSSGSINSTSGFNWLYLPPQGATPPAGAAFTAGNVGLYSATNAATGFNELYLNKTITGPTVTQIPISAYKLGGTNAGNGWTYLPSGLKMAWGRSTTGVANNVTITYSAELTSFPGFTTIFAFPQLTRISGAGTSTNFVTLTAYNQTTFQVYSSAGGTSTQFAWLVIGI